MSKIVFTIDDTFELNKRMIGYHGWEINLGNGMMGSELDIADYHKISKIITEIVNKKKRRKFRFFAREEG